jgi:hypothetical protein
MARSASSALRVAFSRVRSGAARFAIRLGGSRTDPASTAARTTTIGMPGRSPTRATRPFGRTNRVQGASAGTVDAEGVSAWAGVTSAAATALRTMPLTTRRRMAALYRLGDQRISLP